MIYANTKKEAKMLISMEERLFLFMAEAEDSLAEGLVNRIGPLETMRSVTKKYGLPMVPLGALWEAMARAIDTVDADEELLKQLPDLQEAGRISYNA